MLKYCVWSLSAFTLLTGVARADGAPVAVAVAAPPPVADVKVMKRGKLLWLNCAACHYTEADQPGKTLTEKIGPNLHGLIGRPAGAAKGFTYSDAMLKSGLIWDKATLDRWIKRPTDVIPGTKMLYVGMANEADRQALIAYIESETSKK